MLLLAIITGVAVVSKVESDRKKGSTFASAQKPMMLSHTRKVA